LPDRKLLVWAFLLKRDRLSMKPANVLKIDTLENEWRDKDTVMLHACFQLLTDFIKDELYNGYNDWEADEDHRMAKREMEELGSWWETYEEGTVPGKEQSETENRMLIRLINIRWAMWT